MNANCFVDTNVLVYSRDASEPARQPVSRAWVKHLWETRTGRLSVQVLSEYFVTVTGKLTPGLSAEEAWGDVQDLFAWSPRSIDCALLDHARGVQSRFQLSWWDALIVAAAQITQCRYLLTEDLQDGQDFDGVRVVNPFRHAIAEIAEA